MFSRPAFLWPSHSLLWVVFYHDVLTCGPCTGDPISPSLYYQVVSVLVCHLYPVDLQSVGLLLLYPEVIVSTFSILLARGGSCRKQGKVRNVSEFSSSVRAFSSTGEARLCFCFLGLCVLYSELASPTESCRSTKIAPYLFHPGPMT